jgi:hypothetical protein
MKTVPSFLTAVLFTAAFTAQAQTQSAAPAATQPETTAPVVSATPEGATAAPTTESTIATADPKMTEGAMRARASATRRPGSHAGAARPATTPGFKDGVTVREGKVVATESGRSTVVSDSATVKLMTGLTVNGNGTVTRTDGTSETLKEGDYISLTGRLTSAEEAKEHKQELKENLKEDRVKAAKKARSPLGRL